MSVVCVAKYHTAEEALVARSKLEFYGIPAWFPEEHAVRAKWIYLQGASHCHIEVPTSYREDALFLLEEKIDIQADEADEANANGFYKKAMWFTSLMEVAPVVVFAILDHLYCRLKSRLKT